jgi:hypothetical protein
MICGVTHRNPLETGVAKRFQKQIFPQGITVPEVSYRLVPKVMYAKSHALNGQCHSPDTIIRISVETGIFGTTARVVFQAVLVSSLQQIIQIRQQHSKNDSNSLYVSKK